MQKHFDPPGSPPWSARRARCFNAGDSAAMLGCSSTTTRSELLREQHTGIQREFTDYVQDRVIDPGHRVEAVCRAVAEEILGEELGVLAGTLEVAGLSRPLGASLDGLTFLDDRVWECKSMNEELRAALPHAGRDSHERNDGKLLPKDKRTQLEQQLLVTGAEQALFTAGRLNANGELAEERHCWYYPDPALRAEIIAGWKQFEADLATYVPAEAAPVVVAAPVESLPAVSVRMDGALKVIDNLDVFGVALRGFIDKIPAKPTSEQEFADCDAACKALKRAEEALAAAESSALASMSDVEKMRRAVGNLATLAKATRLYTEKLVEARKDQIRLEEVTRGREAIAAHVAALNQQIGKPYMPPVAHDFPGAIKGKRTVASLRDAIDGHLATLKIAANETAGRIQVNLNHLREHAKDHAFLFADTAQLVLKDAEFVAMTVRTRIAEHQAAEQRRAAELAEKERDRIRAEEQAKAQREADAAQEKLRKEQEERRAAGELEYPEALAAAQAGKALEWRRMPQDPWQPRHNTEDMNAHCYYRLAPAAAPRHNTVDGLPAGAARIYADEPLPPLPSANVVPLGTRAPAKPQTPPTLKLGQICERLGFTVTADFLASLGFPVAATEKGAKLFHEHHFADICEALVDHINAVQQSRAAA